MLHWRQRVLVIEIVMLLIVGFLPVNEIYNPIANALTSLSCAMQVESFRKVNGMAYASTMCIGNLRSGMHALSVYLRTHHRDDLRHGCLYFTVIFMFFIGAGIGGLITSCLGGKMIWISSALLTVAFLLMFYRMYE
jgi:uncharacterized membrane protein YoaK (UPF0700 family)